MAINIKDPQTDTLAHELAQTTGETITVAVRERLRAGRRSHSLADELDEIALRCASLPLLDGFLQTWRRFGRGRHPAGLDFGDCFAYALAAASGEPMLFKGKDFSHTDIAAVPIGV